MTAERHQRVKQLFLAACDLDEQQAAALLDQQCTDDPELRKEVESLLEHHLSETIIGHPPHDGKVQEIAREMAAAMAETDRAGGFSSRPESPTEERFPPGTVIAGRWRILASLGRGGMGEVYRADDLKLDQPVALKFLLRKRTEDDTWIGRFHDEVRLARKVTHPNVNRVYDIGEAEGEVFFSMEYVDGEDLASLLRRIDRIAGVKAMQIAGQLCAGLGAAHDQGVLHRDLKPANIMIDGKGQVRITDFGIAALVDDKESGGMAGTPAYMAPELYQGGQPSVRSDLYALGIVLYELLTGKQPFDGLAPNHPARSATPAAPSTVCEGIDGVVEQVVLDCLDADPRRRPESAYAVAAALPGADPLAAAVAAGKTPSPSMVVAAGSHVGLRPIVAIACLGIALLGLIAVVLLAKRTLFLPNAGLDKPPAVLADKAEDIIGSLGYQLEDSGKMQGFAIDRGYLEQARSRRKETPAMGTPSHERQAATYFWYRRGDTRLAPPGPLGEPALVRKFTAEPAMITVRLDGRGRLLRFSAIPTRSLPGKSSSEAPDWSRLFGLAGLDIGKFQKVDPLRGPPMYADQVLAWTGENSGDLPAVIRVEGASLAGRVVYFDIVRPGQQTPASETRRDVSIAPSRTFVVRFLFYLVAMAGGIPLAWRNVRSGRGDQQGARRLALFVLALALLDWIVGERHVSVFAVEVASAYLWVARATLAAATAWVFYMALEVYVRRVWPQTMITWGHLLKGQFRDPLVGRDLLIGGMLGIGTVLILQIDSLLPYWLGISAPLLKLPGPGYDVGELLGLRYKLGTAINVLLTAISLGLVFLLLMTLLCFVVRIRWLAAVLFCIVLTVALSAVSSYDTFLPWITNGVLALLIVLVLTRVGLVAVIAGHFVRALILTNPITSNFTAWYAPAGIFALVVVAALLLYGFRTALAGRPILAPRWLDA